MAAAASITTRRSRRVLLAPLLVLFGSTAAASAQVQPNPYKFPTSSGDDIPILEGYWATSADACGKLQLSDQTRPHVGLKGFPIANSDSFPTYTFQYFGPRLGNWPDGLCYVRAIKRGAEARYRVNGFCGDAPAPDNQFTGEVVVHDERHISISGEGVVPAGEYHFCRSVLAPTVNAPRPKAKGPTVNAPQPDSPTVHTPRPRTNDPTVNAPRE